MMVDVKNLNLIAALLEGLEETIISKIIDRAQFRFNQKIYEKGQSGFEGEHRRSLFDLRLLHQEQMDARFGRFCVPEERPFHKRLPSPKRSVKLPPDGLAISELNLVNLTGEILPRYFDILKKICPGGDDGHYGSSAEHDVYAVQAISRRIHFGSFYVAESKYLSAPETYQNLIHQKDFRGIEQLLTRKEVEDKIIDRVRTKVNFIQAGINLNVRHAINPEILVEFYRDTVIPLTKQGEILYLMNRTKTP